jgi:hypothetical protein
MPDRNREVSPEVSASVGLALLVVFNLLLVFTFSFLLFQLNVSQNQDRRRVAFFGQRCVVEQTKWATSGTVAHDAVMGVGVGEDRESHPRRGGPPQVPRAPTDPLNTTLRLTVTIAIG